MTASHTPASGFDAAKAPDMPRAARRAQKRLLALYAGLRSWQAVAGAVGQDKGLLRRVALGKQKAPPALIRTLYPSRRRRTCANKGLAVWLLGSLWGAK